MNNTENDNPLVKTETDEDHVSQTNDYHIEMSSNIKRLREKKDNNDSKNEEESFLLETIENGNTDKCDASSISTRDDESRCLPLLLIPSSSESLCRICQLGGKETGEDIQTTECDCRGNLSCVHQSCLRQWVYYKGSNKCEICNGRFSTITPPSTPGLLQTEALHNLTWQIERTRPFNKRKRAIMAAVIIFLIIVTSVTTMLTVSADHEFARLSSNPWVTQDQVTKSNIIFSVCIAFSFFCATMTIGLIILWFGLEMCFIVHRRGIIRRATANLLHNQSV